MLPTLLILTLLPHESPGTMKPSLTTLMTWSLQTKTHLRHQALRIRPLTRMLFQLRSNNYISHVMDILLMWRFTSARIRQADYCIGCGSLLPTSHFNIHISSEQRQESRFAPEHERLFRSWPTKSPCMPKCITSAEADCWP